MQCSKGKTRVVVIDPHRLFAECLELALDVEGHDVLRLGLPQSSVSAACMLPLILGQNPDVVLLNLDLGPGSRGLQLIEPLTQSGVGVVVVTSDLDPVRWGEALTHGARVVLPMHGSLTTVAEAVRCVRDDVVAMSLQRRQALVEIYDNADRRRCAGRAQLDRLTRREREILGHLMEGHTVNVIARLDVVSEATVRTQVKAVLAKLEVSSQLGAVCHARGNEWSPRSLLAAS